MKTEIVEVEFIPTEHQGFTEDDRKVVFDIACKCKDSSSFSIEMQKGYQKYFRERALYYTTYPINEQGRMAHQTCNSRIHPKLQIQSLRRVAQRALSFFIPSARRHI